MTEKLYGYLANEPMELDRGEALPDNTLFNLLIGATSAKALKNIGTNAYKQTLRKKELDILKDKRKDWGIAFRSLSGKPKEAIDKLIEVKKGFVPGAFNKSNVGNIDLVWGKGGKKGYGLSHIIDQRNADGINGEEFARQLPEIIEKGQIDNLPTQQNITFIRNGEDNALVKKVWDDKIRNWIVTAFKNK